MYTSAHCLADLIEALDSIARRMPPDERTLQLTAVLLARAIDGLIDYSAVLAREMDFRVRPRACLRIVTTETVKPSRRRRPALRIVGGDETE